MKRILLIATAAAALAGCGGSSYGGGNAASTSKTTSTAASRGPTLYTFARDTPGKSNCSGACAKNWPPAPATLKPPTGVDKAKLGTIKRADGSAQLAYRDRPLYTYVGDTKPGDAKGDGLNAFGGVWHSVAPAAKASKPSSSRSYGY